MLGAVKVLPGKLADSSGETAIEPALLDPPRVEAASILAGHATRASQCAEISPEITAGLPKRSRMEIEAVLARERAEVNVHGPAEAVPTGKALGLFALEVPKRVGDVLQVEADAALQQTRPFTTPVAEKVTVRPLPGFVAVRTAESFVQRGLRLSGSGEDVQGGPRETQNLHGELLHGSCRRLLRRGASC